MPTKHKSHREAKQSVGKQTSEVPGTISFDIIKGNLFRGVHVDGVWGGMTPQGLMAFTFYAERFPIPQQLTHNLKADGMLGDEILDARVSRKTVIREAEVCVYMNMEIAKAFREMLDGQLRKNEAIQRSMKKND
jgi:hypothetical protein